MISSGMCALKKWTVKLIGEFAYARSSLTAVTLPEGVERIGYGAFYH